MVYNLNPALTMCVCVFVRASERWMREGEREKGRDREERERERERESMCV